MDKSIIEFQEDNCSVCNLMAYQCPGEEACMNNHCDVDNGPPPAFVQTCGLCGKPLDECHVGPCPWGDPRKAVWIEFAEGYADWVACPEDCLACELEELCRR
jgi:hypothetical protein